MNWWPAALILGVVLIIAFALTRRNRGLVCEPGDEFPLRGLARVRVWDLFIDLKQKTLNIKGEVIPMGPLPTRHGRYDISPGEQPNHAVVRIVPTPDSEFRADVDMLCESPCTPLVSPDFEGIALAGPTEISVSESIRDDWKDSWVQNKVAHFVVAGYHCFTAKTLTQPGGAQGDIVLVIENRGTGHVTRRELDQLLSIHRYEVLGIHESPAPHPDIDDDPWVPGPGFVSLGGYFHAPMGLFVSEPDESFDLCVYAECRGFRSNDVVVRINP